MAGIAAGSIDAAPSPSTRSCGAALAATARTGTARAVEDAGPALVVNSLAAGATYAGPIVLPRKAGQDWITIRTSAPDGVLPAPGHRVGCGRERGE